MTTPVLMLTARDAVPDRVRGLEAGGDDYLVKPFAAEELVARIRALTRRGVPAAERLQFADLALDLPTHTATRGGRSTELSGREAALLELLLRDTSSVLTRERALEQVWDDAAVPNVVDRYVGRLRRKLGEPPLIHTVRGVGFMLRSCPRARSAPASSRSPSARSSSRWRCSGWPRARSPRGSWARRWTARSSSAPATSRA